MKTFFVLLAASSLHALEPLPLMDTVTVIGIDLSTTSPPKGLVMDKGMGLLIVDAIQGQVVQRTKTRILETRATMTPKSDGDTTTPILGAHVFVEVMKKAGNRIELGSLPGAILTYMVKDKTVFDPKADMWTSMKIMQMPEKDHAGNPIIEPNAGCNQRHDRNLGHQQRDGLSRDPQRRNNRPLLAKIL